MASLLCSGILLGSGCTTGKEKDGVINKNKDFKEFFLAIKAVQNSEDKDLRNNAQKLLRALEKIEGIQGSSLQGHLNDLENAFANKDDINNIKGCLESI